jgi:hypothetical protein
VTEPLPLSSLFKKTHKDGDVMESEGNEGTRRPLLLRPTILVPGVIIAAINLAAISLVEKFYSATEALFLSTPIKHGGLGFTPPTIGTFSSVSAIVIGASQLFIFPRMHEERGSRYISLLGASATLPRFVLWPLVNRVVARDGYTAWVVWFSLGTLVCCSVLANFASRKSFHVHVMFSDKPVIMGLKVAIWVSISQLPGSRSSLSAVLGFSQVCCT